MKKRTIILCLTLFLLSASSVRASDPPIIVQGGNIALGILAAMLGL